MTSTEKMIDAMTSDLAESLKDQVSRIENKPMTTQDHYADYMTMLSMGKNSAGTKIIYIALKKAGANVNGLDSAMRLSA